MISEKRLEPLILACSVALSRFAFRSHYLYDLDSVNFALALEHFDPRLDQPHPPGYFLYVGLGRITNLIVHDANLAFVILSIAASCGAIVLIYKMALAWFGLSEARFASIIFLCSPLGWFHGTVALTYSVEAFFSALLGYLCWSINCGRVALVVPAAVVLGVSAGVRPSSLLFLGPLYLYSMRKTQTGRRYLGIAVLGLTIATWFLPMIRASGGFTAYYSAMVSLWQLVPSNNTVFNSSPATSIARACTIIFIYFLGFGTSSVALIYANWQHIPGDHEKRFYTAVWVAPALCFFTLIFLQFVNSGYLLLLGPPACVWLGFWASEWYRSGALQKPIKLAVIGVCAAVNFLIFLKAPLYCSYRSVRYFEAQLKGIQTIVPQIGGADDTLIISFDSHFLGYRHAGYYLPEYLTVQYPELNLQSGTRVFAMRHGDTVLLANLPNGPYSRFVLFPLPAGDRTNREYLAKVMSLLPNEGIRTVNVNGYDLVTGPTSMLSLLFPIAAAGSPEGVYPPLHSRTLPVNSREHQESKSQ